MPATLQGLHPARESDLGDGRRGNGNRSRFRPVGDAPAREYDRPAGHYQETSARNHDCSCLEDAGHDFIIAVVQQARVGAGIFRLGEFLGSRRLTNPQPF